MNNPRMFWTDDRLAELRRLAADGFSGGEICAKLGAASRNAVAGAAHRYGIPLSPRREGPSPRTIRRSKAQPRKLSRPRTAPVIDLPRFIPARDPVSEKRRATSLAKVAANAKTDAQRIAAGIAFFDLEPNHCRWPLSENVPLSDFRFCGCPIFFRSYCAEHYARAIQVPWRQMKAEAAE